MLWRFALEEHRNSSYIENNYNYLLNSNELNYNYRFNCKSISARRMNGENSRKILLERQPWKIPCAFFKLKWHAIVELFCFVKHTLWPTCLNGWCFQQYVHFLKKKSEDFLCNYDNRVKIRREIHLGWEFFFCRQIRSVQINIFELKFFN